MKYSAYIAIDWADKEHKLCLCESDSGLAQHDSLAQTPEAIGRWAIALRKRHSGKTNRYNPRAKTWRAYSCAHEI